MAKEDILLGVEMRKLEIEPTKIHNKLLEENPFKSPPSHPSTTRTNKLCACSQRLSKHVAIGKRKRTRIIKEPVLKILKTSGSKDTCLNDCQLTARKDILQCSQSHARNPDHLNLCALVDNCNQLRISADDQTEAIIGSANNKHWWKSNLVSSRQTRERGSSVGVSRAGSCSQQALNPPCDVTIDELASYFETLVHIPKKMSSMAEMMYI